MNSKHTEEVVNTLDFQRKKEYIRRLNEGLDEAKAKRDRGRGANRNPRIIK